MKTYKTIKIIVISFAIVILGFLTYFIIDFFTISESVKQQIAWKEEIYEKLQQSKEKGVEKVVLSDITPFEWDTAYIFTTAISEDLFYETFGEMHVPIELTNSDISLYWCFIKDDKVVFGEYMSEYYLVRSIYDEINAGSQIANHDIIVIVKPGEEIKIYYLEGEEPE